MTRKNKLNSIKRSIKRKTALHTGGRKEYTNLLIEAIDLAIDEENRMDAMVREYETMQAIRE